MDKESFSVNSIAKEIMEMSRNKVFVNYRFFSSAVSKLNFEESFETVSLKTDGKTLYYLPRHILLSYKNDPELPFREMMHSLLHCILCHGFVGEKIDRLRWNTACDIVCENILVELDIKGCDRNNKISRDNVISSLKRKIKYFTAESVYHYFIESGIGDRDVHSMEALFFCDEHDLWYDASKDGAQVSKGMQKKDIEGQNCDSANGMRGNKGRSGRSEEGEGEEESENAKGNSSRGNGKLKSKAERQREEKEWKLIAKGIEKDLESFSKNAGTGSGSLIASLCEIQREKYDYEDFLRKFSVRGEVIKTSPDEFDYIYYTYGLKLYDNLPLIEPLEYSDDKKIRDFVIAIDTSGSCSKVLVKQFIYKTVDILFESKYFFKKINIHVVQCDSKIQHDDVITSKDDLIKFAENIKIYGGGGTDFRPVFKYINELKDNGQIINLKGLIYFTDGIGIFPETKPSYDTAFVFVEEGEAEHKVPVWAMKIVLDKYDTRGESIG